MGEVLLPCASSIHAGVGQFSTVCESKDWGLTNTMLYTEHNFSTHVLCLSETWHFKVLFGVLWHLQVKFTSIAWTHDHKGFFYNRYPQPEYVFNITTTLVDVRVFWGKNPGLLRVAFFSSFGWPLKKNPTVLALEV